MEMGMQDSADMCGCVIKLDKLSRKRIWRKGADSAHW
jgi:hypothetical protein